MGAGFRGQVLQFIEIEAQAPNPGGTRDPGLRMADWSTA